MGNHRFRLSGMIPNTWLYKLRYMGKSSTTIYTTPHSLPTPSNPNQNKPHLPALPRKSYYFTREILPPSPPPKHQPKTRPPVSAACSCRASLNSVWTKSDFPPFTADRFLPDDSLDLGVVSWSTTCTCPNHIFIDAGNSSAPKNFDTTISELHLAPIITKPAKFSDMVKHIKKNGSKERTRSSAKHQEANAGSSESVKISKEHKISHGRRISTNSPGLRLRTNSPRIWNKRMQPSSRKSSSISDSFAVVKLSANPRRDFRDSMVEMIVENNICASKDLEELLACYLSLNLDEYHDLIIKEFKQIWFDLTQS